MSYLVLLHVLSAIIGVGPVFFYPVLFRKKQTMEELRHSLRTAGMLELFPKIGGTIAVLSGITLALVGSYGSFLQLWLLGSLVLYIIIQVIVIGLIAPKMKRLSAWFQDEANAGATDLAPDMQQLHHKIYSLFMTACAIGLLLFIFMILKP